MPFNRADFYDAELRRHNLHFRAALTVGPRDCVLDIGCGAGQSTREAAYAAAQGAVLGVDVSEELLAVARKRCAEAGLPNVTFVLADAQVYRFSQGYFDVCISRFGVMFFADPVAAFRNIGNALRPGGRLVLMVWQNYSANEWATAIQGALNAKGSSSAPAAAAFSLGDRAVTTSILTAAGFVSISFSAVYEPVFYGSDVHAAHEAVVELFLGNHGTVRTKAAVDEIRRPLRALLDAHLTESGVLFDSRAWIVIAHKPLEQKKPQDVITR